MEACTSKTAWERRGGTCGANCMFYSIVQIILLSSILKILSPLFPLVVCIWRECPFCLIHSSCNSDECIFSHINIIFCRFHLVLIWVTVHQLSIWTCQISWMVTNQYPMKKPENISARTYHKGKYLVFFLQISKWSILFTYLQTISGLRWAAYVAGTILILMTELGVQFADSMSILVWT
jgi:hypothetical protein